MANYGTCENCGMTAPLVHGSYTRIIGAIILMFYGTRRGNLCRECHGKFYREMSLITLFGGWWGVISAIATPIILIVNTVTYLVAINKLGAAQSVPPPPPPYAGGAPPVLPPPGVGVPPAVSQPAATPDQAVNLLAPYAADVRSRLQAGQPVPIIARDLAQRAGVTHEQAMLFVSQQRE